MPISTYFVLSSLIRYVLFLYSYDPDKQVRTSHSECIFLPVEAKSLSLRLKDFLDLRRRLKLRGLVMLIQLQDVDYAKVINIT